jgi:hypothetical protein
MTRDYLDEIKISVINSQGNLVLLQRIHLAYNNQMFAINGINLLPPGNYTTILQWESGKTVIKKLTKL